MTNAWLFVAICVLLDGIELMHVRKKNDIINYLILCYFKFSLFYFLYSYNPYCNKTNENLNLRVLFCIDEKHVIHVVKKNGDAFCNELSFDVHQNHLETWQQSNFNNWTRNLKKDICQKLGQATILGIN
jgi:hypothetical protein